jgi:hypothetical protein
LPKAAHPFQTPHLVPHSKVSPFLLPESR